MNKILSYSIILLILFAWWSSLTIGLSSDEYFHHINGLVRYKFLTSLGEIQKFEYRNNEYYPGLYDTISYAIGQIIFLVNKNFYINNIDIVMHIVNVLFSTLSILGLYLLTKKLFNKKIALFAVLLTLLNPFFFGHMGMNSKDIIVFFALIWSCYYLYLYCIENSNSLKYLILFSLFFGFGCGVRLTFIVVIFPVIIVALYYLFKKYKSNYLQLTKRLSLHIPIVFMITIFLVILCWPHVIVEINKGNFFEFLFDIIKKTINWKQGPKIGLLNGDYYEVFNTPKSYFLYVVAYRLPFYFTLLSVASFILLFLGKLNTENEIKNYNQKFFLVSLVALFPILLILILSVNVYDNLRLFLFIIPLLCIIASLSLDYFIKTFKKSIFIKISSLTLLLLFSLSFYKFIILTPYQYTYVNFSYPSLGRSVEKFEQDYWGTSYKELVNNMKNKFSKKEIQEFKIADCYGGDSTLLYYLNKNFGVKRLYNIDERPLRATHIVLTNRTFLNAINNPSVEGLVNEKGVVLASDLEKVVRAPNVKTTCFTQYSGKDEVVVFRDGAALSSLRKLN